MCTEHYHMAHALWKGDLLHLHKMSSKISLCSLDFSSIVSFMFFALYIYMFAIHRFKIITFFAHLNLNGVCIWYKVVTKGIHVDLLLSICSFPFCTFFVLRGYQKVLVATRMKLCFASLSTSLWVFQVLVLFCFLHQDLCYFFNQKIFF